MKKITLLMATLLTSAYAFAQPTISSLTPASGPIGTTVIITGNNFNTTPANNIVFFGAVSATVTAASAISLTVTVPVGATYQPITVTTNGLTAYSIQPFIVTFTNGGFFGAKKDFVTNTAFPQTISLGDLNGDGKSDLVMGGDFIPYNISAFKNTSTNSKFSFADKIDYEIDNYTYGSALGDLDGDGKLDIAVSNYYGSSTISVFRNLSSGENISFASKIDFTTGSHSRGLCISDFNGDGKPDIVVACQFGYNSILKNTSTIGNISFAPKIDLEAGSEPLYVAAGDFDGDGRPDLAVANGSEYTVSIYRNTSTGGNISFAGKQDYQFQNYPFDVSIADLDGDGKSDIVVTVAGAIVSVLRNTSTTGNISFAQKSDFTGGSYGEVSISDLDGDGKPDLAVAGGPLSILKNTSIPGMISFAKAENYQLGTDGVSIGDLDADGKPDLAVTGNYGFTILGNTNTFSGPTISEVTDINSSQALVHWHPFANAISYLVRKYPSYTTDYTYYSPVADTFRRVNNMQPFTSYSVQVKAILNNNDSSDWSFPYSFETANNCPAPWNLRVTKITDTSARVNWKLPDASVILINIRYRVLGTSTWKEEEKKFTENSILLGGLLPNTTYEWKVRNLCSDDRTYWVDGPNFITSGVLPLQVISFNAALQKNNVTLNWQTTSEINTAYFNIQRSNNGNNFTTIAKQNAAGSGLTNKYFFSDAGVNALQHATIFYRLQMVDRDASSAYSKIVALNVNDSNGVFFSIFPNPARDKLHFSIGCTENTTLSILIVDIYGRHVYTNTLSTVAGTFHHDIDISKMATGIYTIQLISDKGITISKFVKE